jgi:hypothetical protein
MEIYLEFGGGLGDIFNQMYLRFQYNILADLGPKDNARVGIISHNPFIGELFRWHPKRSQMEIIECGYWHQSDEAVNRIKWNLPALGFCPLPEKKGPIEFHISDIEQNTLNKLLGSLGKTFVVISAAAGLPDRNLPDSILASVFKLGLDCPLVLVGRNYERCGRREVDPARIVELLNNDRATCVHNVVDQFSVPAIAKLVQASSGIITCHSALSILGWHLRKPQLLLYPESVRVRHFITKDEWSFGSAFAETVHGTFDEYSEMLAIRFFNLIKSPE